MGALSEHFDVVVVGSGFGGSVMAYRAAEAGLRVCLLERGRAYPPGSFPRGPAGYRDNFWDPSRGLHGMFNVWSFDSLEAVVSSGLGGGSLIYANVLLRKDPKWFVRDGFRDGVYEYWPVSYEELEPHYEAVEKILGATPYPLAHEPYSKTAKTRAMQMAAERLGKEWFLPNLAVTFGNDPQRPRPGEPLRELHANYHGKDNRSSCRLCGECDVGCNYGAKNTLDFNYLTMAQRLGAVILTRREVRSFRPRERAGFEIDYVSHEDARDGKARDTRSLPTETITADRLVLSAGSLGSTYLLMKNAAAFPRLSATLGSRFCGNGDFLSFALECSDELESRRIPRPLNPTAAPVITSTMRGDDFADGGNGPGYYLQDAGYPEWVSWLVEAASSPSELSHYARVAWERVRSVVTNDPDRNLGNVISELLGESDTSGCSMPLLGMGRDAPDGKMHLREKDGQSYLNVDWKDDKSLEHFDRLRHASKAVAEALGGKYIESPLLKFFNRLITVHPLGGCPMGRNPNEGTVDSYGRVFGAPGMYIADGSVMPGPVGANPSLTIAALANRFASQLIDDHKRGGL
jgi:cholesterol oxidase